MTHEELLRPRYRVIADYPGTQYSTGDILPVIGTELYTKGRIDFLNSYPHLFQPLPWWSDREIGDMPEYLKCLGRPDFCFNKGDIIMVDKWIESFGPTLRFYTTHTDKITLHPHLYTPATLAEYEAYQQLNK